MMLSKRILAMPASPIRKLAPFAFRAKKKGIKIYHLNIGDPDIKTPAVMIRTINDWSKNPVPYSQSSGDEKMMEALAWYYHRLGFKKIKPENILVTIGGSEAILISLLAVCDPGDEMIIFDPCYPNYLSLGAAVGVNFIPILTTIKNGFHLPDKKIIESQITKKTKAILICNPNNPTGTVYRQDEIKMLVDIARKNNLFLISDEVYREFCYQGKNHISVLNYIDQLPEKIILLDSLSKRYSLCGLRLGCLVSFNQPLIENSLKFAQARLSAGSIDQYIAAKLTKVNRDYFFKNIKEYQKRRDYLYNHLRKIKGIKLYLPEGAFYMIVSLPVDDAEKFCRWLLTDFQLNQETVMLAPAAGFYKTAGQGKKEVRIAYVLKIADLKKSLKILEEGLRGYNKILNIKY